MKRWLFLATALTAALLAFAACQGEGPPVAEAPEHEEEAMQHVEGTLHVFLDEWSITEEGTGANAFTVPAGEITFEVHNEGVAPHELVVIRTDLAAKALPIADGTVDEQAAGQVLGRTGEFPGGEIKVIAYDMEPGQYVLVCNIPGHYQQGMFAEMTVE